MTNIYEIILKQYPPYWEQQDLSPRYTVIFSSKDKQQALAYMEGYVNQHGFMTPDEKETIEDILLREKELIGRVISATSYLELFDVATNKLLK